MCCWIAGLAASLVAIKVSFIGKDHYLGSQGDLSLKFSWYVKCGHVVWANALSLPDSKSLVRYSGLDCMFLLCFVSFENMYVCVLLKNIAAPV